MRSLGILCNASCVAVLFLVVALPLLHPVVVAVRIDEAGSIDWLHKNIGEVIDAQWMNVALPRQRDPHTFLLTGTTAGAVSALNVSDGTLHWRRLLPSQNGRVRRVLARASPPSALLYALAQGTRTTPPHLFALRADNGLVEWQSPLSTAVADEEQEQEGAAALRQPLWGGASHRDLAALRQLPSSPSLLLAIVGASHLCAFDTAERSPTWCVDASSAAPLSSRSDLLAVTFHQQHPENLAQQHLYLLVADTQSASSAEQLRLIRVAAHSGELSAAEVQPPAHTTARDCTLFSEGPSTPPLLACVLDGVAQLWVSPVTGGVAPLRSAIRLEAGQSLHGLLNDRGHGTLGGDAHLLRGVLLRIVAEIPASSASSASSTSTSSSASSTSTSSASPAATPSSFYLYYCADEATNSWRECGRFASDSVFSVVDGGAALAVLSSPAAPDDSRSLQVVGKGGTSLFSYRLAVTSEEVPQRRLFVGWPRSGEGRHATACLVAADHALAYLPSLSAAISWTRNEALGELDADVLYMELPRSLSLTPRETVEMESLLLHPPTPLAAFLRRVRMQLHALVHTLSGSTADEEPAQERARSASPVRRLHEEHMYADSYGFRQLVLATNAHARTVLALDSLTGAVVWQSYLPPAQHLVAVAKGLRVVGLHLVRTSAHPPPRLLLVAHDEEADRSRSWLLDALSGELLEQRWLPEGIVPQSTVLLPTAVGPERYRVVLALCEGGSQPQLFPESEEARAAVALLAPKLYLHEAVAAGKQARLSGYQLVQRADGELLPEPRWQLVFSGAPGETLLGVEHLTPEQQLGSGPGLPVRVIGDGAIGEYPSAHLLAVATQTRIAGSQSGERQTPPESGITVYVVCGVTGRVLASARHRNAAGPVRLLLRDGWLLYSYWNLQARRQELGSLALFDRWLDWEQNRRQSTTPLCDGDDAERLGVTHLAEEGAPTYSAYSLPLPQVVRSSFPSPAAVVALHATTLARGLGGRHALVATANGEVLSLPDQLLDARRSLPSAAAEGLLPAEDQRLAALGPRFRPTHGVRVAGLRHLASAGASVESTSLVLAWGLDVWGSRIAPSRTFDLLTSDFNYVMLVMLSAGLVVAIYALRTMTTRATRKEHWK